MPGLLDAFSDPQFQSEVAARAKRFAMIPDQSAYGVGQMPPAETLAAMPWADLLQLRKTLKSTQDQNALAPYEHRAYMREYTTGPADALVNSVMTLGYTPYKVATGDGRSDPQLRGIGQGLLGVFEGLTK